MTPNETTICVLGAIGVVALAYLGYCQTGSKPVPQVQGEGQAMGLGVQATNRICAGTPLDMRPEIHFWSPGFDVNPAEPVVQPRHRYPAIPGGNMSTVMHKGWGAFNTDAPAGNDWMITPPEVAVL